MLSPATITEKVVELDCVIGLSIAGEHPGIGIIYTDRDDTHTPDTGPKDMSGDRGMRPVHTPSPGPQCKQRITVNNCVLLSTGVQPTEETADLRKVKLDSESTNLERTPVMVDGKLERFKDIGSMITQWEELEDNDKEWVVEEGVRRGGRKISRRMSELIGIFGEENARIVGQTNGVAFGSDTTLSSKPDSVCSNSDISSLSSRKTENTQTSNINHIRSNAFFMDEKTLSAGCDWPVGLTSIYLPTNESREGRKRKYVSDGDGGGGGGRTKKLRRDGSAILFSI